jgi:hypothetical protein
MRDRPDFGPSKAWWEYQAASENLPLCQGFHVVGFSEQFWWGEPPVYAGVKAGNALLHVCHDPVMARAIR